MTADVIERRIHLRGAALSLMANRSPEVLLAGPAGTGKSYAALWKIHTMCMLNGACEKGCKKDHEHHSSGMRALVVRKTHKSLTATGLVTFRDHVANDAISHRICWWYGGSGEKPAQYIYGNGSLIVVGGLDQPDKIMSSEYDVIFVQEATDCTKDDWEKLTTRLRNGRVSFQQLIADANPQAPSHWLKKRCDEGKTVMLYSHHEDNPRLFDDHGQITEGGSTYIARLDALSGVRKERLRWGRWAAAEGIIYEGWRPDVHLSDRKVLPREWDRVWGVDFGYTNPFVWQQWAIDPDGRLWLEKEIYRAQRLVEDHAKDILAVVKRKSDGEWKYPRPRAIVCDHDAEDRATLERHLGMGTVAATKTVSDGIQAVQTRLKILADGQPRLYACRDALVERDEELAGAGKPLGFIQEIEGYVWKPQPNAVQGREKAVPDEPEKINDHSMDAARYVVAWADLQPRPRIRIMG